MLSNYKPTKEQQVLIGQLSKDVDLPKNEIMQFLIEIGISSLIASRNGDETKFVQSMQHQQNSIPTLNRISQRLTHFYNNG